MCGYEKERKKEQIVFSHHLAKEIADFARDYAEVYEIIGRVQQEFRQAGRKSKPVIKEQPTDAWGLPIGVEV